MGTSRSSRSSKHRRHVRAIAFIATATLSALGTTGVAPSWAAGPLPTTTTVSTSSASAFVGSPVTVTAKVSVLGQPGLGVTPTGTVAFTDTVGGTTSALGSAALGSCLLTVCQASLTTSSLAVGSHTLSGTYSGDTLAASSSDSASVVVSFLPEPTPTVQQTTTCSGTSACTASVATPDGNNALTVSSRPEDDEETTTSGSQSVSAALTEGARLDCTPVSGDVVVHDGAMATFSATLDKTVTRTYHDTTSGSTATDVNTNYVHHPTFFGCYASPNPFNGYSSTGTYGPAPRLTTPYGVFYEAYLGSCANNGGALPCFQYTNGLAAHPAYTRLVVRVPAGDPKLTP